MLLSSRIFPGELFHYLLGHIDSHENHVVQEHGCKDADVHPSHIVADLWVWDEFTKDDQEVGVEQNEDFINDFVPVAFLRVKGPYPPLVDDHEASQQ